MHIPQILLYRIGKERENKRKNIMSIDSIRNYFIYESCGVLLKIVNEIMNIGISPLVLKLFEQFKTSPTIRNVLSFFLSCYIKQNPKEIEWPC
jgi:hypothetical protein